MVCLQIFTPAIQSASDHVSANWWNAPSRGKGCQHRACGICVFRNTPGGDQTPINIQSDLCSTILSEPKPTSAIKRNDYVPCSCKKVLVEYDHIDVGRTTTGVVRRAKGPSGLQRSWAKPGRSAPNY